MKKKLKWKSSYYKYVEPMRETYLKDKANGHEIIIIHFGNRNGQKRIDTIDYRDLTEDFKFNDTFFEPSSQNEWQCKLKIYRNYVKYVKTQEYNFN